MFNINLASESDPGYNGLVSCLIDAIQKSNVYEINRLMTANRQFATSALTDACAQIGVDVKYSPADGAVITSEDFVPADQRLASSDLPPALPEIGANHDYRNGELVSLKGHYFVFYSLDRLQQLAKYYSHIEPLRNLVHSSQVEYSGGALIPLDHQHGFWEGIDEHRAAKFTVYKQAAEA